VDASVDWVHYDENLLHLNLKQWTSIIIMVCLVVITRLENLKYIINVSEFWFSLHVHFEQNSIGLRETKDQCSTSELVGNLPPTLTPTCHNNDELYTWNCYSASNVLNFKLLFHGVCIFQFSIRLRWVRSWGLSQSIEAFCQENTEGDILCRKKDNCLMKMFPIFCFRFRKKLHINPGIR